MWRRVGWDDTHDSNRAERVDGCKRYVDGEEGIDILTFHGDLESAGPADTGWGEGERAGAGAA